MSSMGVRLFILELAEYLKVVETNLDGIEGRIEGVEAVLGKHEEF